VSVGAAAYDPAAPLDLDDLLAAADGAMYRDKVARQDELAVTPAVVGN